MQIVVTASIDFPLYKTIRRKPYHEVILSCFFALIINYDSWLEFTWKNYVLYSVISDLRKHSYTLKLDVKTPQTSGTGTCTGISGPTYSPGDIREDVSSDSDQEGTGSECSNLGYPCSEPLYHCSEAQAYAKLRHICDYWGSPSESEQCSGSDGSRATMVPSKLGSMVTKRDPKRAPFRASLGRPWYPPKHVG